MDWLCKVHDKTRSDMERQLQDLERSDMITFGEVEDRPIISLHEIYWRYAKWHATNHGVKRFKNAWCVFNTLDQKYVVSELVRLQIFNLERASVRLLASKMMRELYELEVLQLDSCPYLTELNLEGLESLRYLELWELPNLVAVTLTGIGESGGILESLQFVVLWELSSLVHGPDVRSCTSLHACHVIGDVSMTNMDGLECPTLKVLDISSLSMHQLARLPNVNTLQSLEVFMLRCDFGVAMSDVEASRKLKLRDLGKPYMKVVEEFLTYLCTEQVERGMNLHICWRKCDPLSESLFLEDSHGDEYEWR